MTDLIRVTIAPGRRLKIDPHPAGASYGILWLEAGDTLDATAEEVGRLYTAGTILHPTTGLPRPQVKPTAGRVTITSNGRELAEGEVLLPTREENEARTAALHAEIDRRNETLRQARQRAADDRAPVLITDRHGNQRDPYWPRLRDQYGEF